MNLTAFICRGCEILVSLSLSVFVLLGQVCLLADKYSDFTISSCIFSCDWCESNAFLLLKVFLFAMIQLVEYNVVFIDTILNYDPGTVLSSTLVRLMKAA